MFAMQWGFGNDCLEAVEHGVLEPEWQWLKWPYCSPGLGCWTLEWDVFETLEQHV